MYGASERMKSCKLAGRADTDGRADDRGRLMYTFRAGKRQSGFDRFPRPDDCVSLFGDEGWWIAKTSGLRIPPIIRKDAVVRRGWISWRGSHLRLRTRHLLGTHILKRAIRVRN